MSIVEFHGGPITHRYLMNKSKHDLARMVLDGLEREEKLRAKLEAAPSASPPAKVEPCEHGVPQPKFCQRCYPYQRPDAQ